MIEDTLINGQVIKLSVIGRADDVQVLHVDREGGFVADILRDDHIIRIWYTAPSWTPGTWTTRPEEIPESVRMEVLA